MLQTFVFMNSIEATTRNTKTRGEVNSLRIDGNVPAIIYGGTEENQKISLSKKVVKVLIEKETIDGNEFCSILKEYTNIPEKARSFESIK